MNHQPYCMLCGDDLIHVSDGNGETWLVHAHMRNDDHVVVPACDQDVPYTVTDLWIGLMIVAGTIVWFFTR